MEGEDKKLRVQGTKSRLHQKAKGLPLKRGNEIEEGGGFSGTRTCCSQLSNEGRRLRRTNIQRLPRKKLKNIKEKKKSNVRDEEGKAELKSGRR